MDVATLAGLVVAFSALLLSVLIEGGHLGAFFNIPAGILVLGGTFGVMVTCFPLEQTLAIPRIMRNAFFAQKTDPLEMVRTIVEFARRALKDGLLALEDDLKNVPGNFVRTALRLVVDGTPQELVREILETRAQTMQQRHAAGEQIFSALGGYAPTLGILGTVMGLIHMLSKLSEPDKMGPAIAGAFIATLYGVGSANLVFLPIAQKLKARSTEELETYHMAIEGILSLQAGDNPRTVGEKMVAFLPPKLRAQYEAGAAAGKGAA